MVYVQKKFDIESHTEVRDLAQRLDGVFNPRERRVLEGRVQEYTFAKIASQEGMPTSKVKANMQEVMFKLHRLSGDYSREEIAKAVSLYLKNAQN